MAEPTTSFRIKKASTAGTPAEPAKAYWPTTAAPPVVRYPTPTKTNGRGQPGGFVGKPEVEIGRERMTEAGLEYYSSLFVSTSGSAYVKAQLYDPRAAAGAHWKIYEGVAWRPTYAEDVVGGPVFKDFRMLITELTESTW